MSDLTRKAVETLRREGAPRSLLDLVSWVGPRLESIDQPDEFLRVYTLALSELAQGRSSPGHVLQGSLVLKPPYVYVALTLSVSRIAYAFHGRSFSLDVERLRLASS